MSDPDLNLFITSCLESINIDGETIREDATDNFDVADALIEGAGKPAENDARLEPKVEAAGKDAKVEVAGKDAAVVRNREPQQEAKVYPQELEGVVPEITPTDMITLLYAEIERKGIAGHHIDSMNSFFSEGINQIATQVFNIEGRMKNERDDKDPADRDIAEISYKVEFTGTRLTKPSSTKYLSGKAELLTPNMARIKGQTYSVQMHIDARITATAHYKNGGSKVITDEIKDHRIAAIPCLVRSSQCNTHLCSREMLKRWEEDPNNPGGYFIIKGGEWTVDNLENLTHNIFHCYIQSYENEVVRGTFISKPGDAYENSYQTLIRYFNNGAITIDVTITKKVVLQVPFYIIFRALGMTSDRDIVNHIVYGVDNGDPTTKSILAILEKAFEVDDPKYSTIRKSTHPPEIIEFLASKLIEVVNVAAAKRDDNVAKHQHNTVLNTFDRFFLPHVGTEPEYRIRKLKFLGHLINKLILVHLRVVEQTDRDSYKNKRVHSAGTSMAKTFKTHYNIAFVQQVKKSLITALKTTPFSQVQLAKSIKQVTKSEALEKPLTQSITAGTGKMISHRTVTVKNRVSSQTIYHKNDLNVKSTLNTVNTPDANIGSKNTERADVMRRVHPTYVGYIDVSQSADTGEKVGMSKQLACTASVCGASSSYNLKKILLRDPAIIPIDYVQMEDISRLKYSKVFVGGDWIGCCTNSHDLTYRYRQARRYGDINQFTTIVWEPLVREVYFWTDVGRLVRPLVIVYNNITQYNEEVRKGNRVEFKQWIKLTREHIKGLLSRKLTMDDLRAERVIEYISPEEQESAFLAENIDTLRRHQNDVRYRYTHCNIDQSIFGIVTLAAPMGNHSGTVRNTLYTNHRKQSTGWFALNYPYRIDKHVTLQHYCERPLISAFSDAITYPNGQNAEVGLMLHGGYNCEDSIVANQSSIDCGLFNASHYNYEKSEMEKNEKLANPDLARTLDIKKDAIYENVQDGLILPGALVQKGSVLISKYVPIQNPTDIHIYTDRSVLYKQEEPVRVERSIVVRNDADVLVAKVKTRANRPLEIGDKLSSRTGNKGICGAKHPRADMPYCEDGTIPDLLVNAHSVPTRMALNQIIECVLGQLAARKGTSFDSTIFRPVNIEEAIAELEKQGIKYGGHRRMWNGRTGCWIDTLIFVGPTVYQRLQKFVIDEHYSTRTGPTSILTQQPLDGKSNDGGLRLGEMEGWVICAHGSMHLLHNKFYKDSDGMTIPVCRVCSQPAIVNEKKQIYRCRKCRDRADIVAVQSSRCANLFANESGAMNAKIQFNIAPFTYPNDGGVEEGL